MLFVGSKRDGTKDSTAGVSIRSKEEREEGTSSDTSRLRESNVSVCAGTSDQNIQMSILMRKEYIDSMVLVQKREGTKDSNVASALASD